MEKNQIIKYSKNKVLCPRCEVNYMMKTSKNCIICERTKRNKRNGRGFETNFSMNTLRRFLKQRWIEREGRHYVRVGRRGKKYLPVSRIIWTLHNGYIPPFMEIDHIVPISAFPKMISPKFINKIENLQLLTIQENASKKAKTKYKKRLDLVGEKMNEILGDLKKQSKNDRYSRFNFRR